MSVIINGVEYFETPIPTDLWRATQYKHAVDLMNTGLLYLSNAQKYREDPDPKRGDSTETDGRFIRQGTTCNTGHTNPIFLWCATLDSSPKSPLSVWKDCDTVIHINNPQVLAERMLKAAKKQGVDGISFHAGRPIYDKNKGGTHQYNWAESIFQKPEGQAQQREYRFALVGSCAISNMHCVKLEIGACNDIISIAKRR